MYDLYSEHNKHNINIKIAGVCRIIDRHLQFLCFRIGIKNPENTGVAEILLNSDDCCCLRERTCINTLKMVR